MNTLTSFGVEQNIRTNMYRIYFLFGTLKFFLGEDIITEDATLALETEDMEFAFDELKQIMKDKDFLDHLEACSVLGGD